VLFKLHMDSRSSFVIKGEVSIETRLPKLTPFISSSNILKNLENVRGKKRKKSQTVNDSRKLGVVILKGSVLKTCYQISALTPGSDVSRGHSLPTPL